jgi:hypothetical protein
MRRPRLSYANVTSSLALFIALGGTGYAVTKLPRNSVGATQLKANAVTSGKIRAGAVQKSDLSPSARSGSRGPRGPAGPPGPAGAGGTGGGAGAVGEVIQAKRPGIASISPDAGGAAALASLTLTPGSWLLDANTTIIYAPTPDASDYFDCILQTAASDVLAKGVLRVGDVAGSVVGGHVPLHVAATFDVATQVTYRCSHATAIPAGPPGQPYADRTTLQATRVASVDDR